VRVLTVVVCVPAVSPPTRLVPRVETCPMRVKARVKGATGNVFLFYPPGPTRTPESRVPGDPRERRGAGSCCAG